MPRSRMIFSSVLVVVLGMGVGVAVERSHGEGRHAPGMGIIAGTARKTPVLFQILRGQVPATIEQSVTFADPTGRVTTYQPQGATATDGNAFFSSDITTNGRTCFTCHQPQNGWEISPPQIAAQLVLTRGRSALFQPIDAADCPSSPGAMARFPDRRFVGSRSQLFKRGNFRISLNAPNPLGPTDASFTTFDGNTTPEWVLTVERDPLGCELDPEHGLPANLLSVYRRPLPSANTAFLGQDGPENKFDIMWDAREQNLQTQFINATLFHGQATVEPDLDAQTQGAKFQSAMFVAQTFDYRAGDLTGADGSGALGGPRNLYDWRQGSVPACSGSAVGALLCLGIKIKQTLADGTRVNVASELYDSFATPTTGGWLRKAQRESIARGEALFSGRVFTISNVAGLNDIKGDGPEGEPGTCSTCHSNKNVANDTAADPKRLGIMDNSTGVNVMPPTPDFPQFAFYCPLGSIPFFSNEVKSPNCPGGAATCEKFVTTDPGKGLVTGKCQDLGKMKVPILRGAASRAPYFHGGNAATLEDLVDFYNSRFNINLTAQEKRDLVNYLNSL